jgi:phosphoribosylanthranilate isomerase
MGKLSLKICGMRDPGNIAAIAQLKPDYMGFIFYEKSPRSAVGMDCKVVFALPDSVRKVGVFVDAPFEKIEKTVKTYHLDLVQLHGSESPELCHSIRQICPVIKAVSVRSREDIEMTEHCEGVDYWLFDTKTPLHGGSGKQFEWNVLEAYTGKTPFFLSGGISAEDAERLKRLQFPKLHAIDINSCFETAPGLKNVQQVTDFLSKLNS